MRPLLFVLLYTLSAPVHAERPPVPCRSVADCWLDANGAAIPRPRARRGAPLPRGDCGRNLLWLRTRLTCEAQVCVARRVGDMC